MTRNNHAHRICLPAARFLLNCKVSSSFPEPCNLRQVEGPEDSCAKCIVQGFILKYTERSRNSGPDTDIEVAEATIPQS